MNPATTLTRPLPSTICRRDRVGDQIEIPRAAEPLMFRGGVPVRESRRFTPMRSAESAWRRSASALPPGICSTRPAPGPREPYQTSSAGYFADQNRSKSTMCEVSCRRFTTNALSWSTQLARNSMSNGSSKRTATLWLPVAVSRTQMASRSRFS